jgi:hypothetical protein
MAISKFPTPRNVVTKLDDLGLYANLVRLEGESLTNFRSRVLYAQSSPGSASTQGLIDAICNELELGQDFLIQITSTDDSARIKITETQCIVYLNNTIQKTVDLIPLNPDGIWNLISVDNLVSELTDISGIIPVVVSGMGNLPACLLEPQDTVVNITNEQVPRIQSYTLGIQGFGEPPLGPVLINSVTFNDPISYQTQVSGTPSAAGEWSVNTSGRVNLVTTPQDLTLATYSFSLLGSGQTTSLIGNGGRIFNLASEEIQSKLFTYSGITGEAKDILYEIRSVDRNFWGK